MTQYVQMNMRRKEALVAEETKCSHKKHKPFQSHSSFSSVAAAQGLDSVPFLPKRNKTFHPMAEVILLGKSLQAIIRYKCWTYLSGYNLLKEAVTGHLLWQRGGEKSVF